MLRNIVCLGTHVLRFKMHTFGWIGGSATFISGISARVREWHQTWPHIQYARGLWEWGMYIFLRIKPNPWQCQAELCFMRGCNLFERRPNRILAHRWSFHQLARTTKIRRTHSPSTLHRRAEVAYFCDRHYIRHKVLGIAEFCKGNSHC